MAKSGAYSHTVPENIRGSITSELERLLRIYEPAPLSPIKNLRLCEGQTLLKFPQQISFLGLPSSEWAHWPWEMRCRLSRQPRQAMWKRPIKGELTEETGLSSSVQLAYYQRGYLEYTHFIRLLPCLKASNGFPLDRMKSKP